MNTRKIQIPKIDKQLAEIHQEIEEATAWLNATAYAMDYDE
jgi:hypothetical protein